MDTDTWCFKASGSHSLNHHLRFQVYRRMIKCCSYLQCHTQVAVLCQFLDEIDYSAAFKALQERNVYDAMDAYYCCIWDITILEFLVRILWSAMFLKGECMGCRKYFECFCRNVYHAESLIWKGEILIIQSTSFECFVLQLLFYLSLTFCILSLKKKRNFYNALHIKDL